MRTAIFYHYYEKNESYRENLVYFLSVAYRKDLHFFVVIAGSCSATLPNFKNVTYIYTENKNNDYGGYAVALNQLRDLDFFDYFIFCNSSCRGPFFSRLCSRSWTDLFLRKFEKDVELIGSSINIMHNNQRHAVEFRKHFDYAQPYSHVQTTAYALTRRALKHLIDLGFYDTRERLSRIDVVCRYEIRLSQEIKRAGWNFKSLLRKYNSINFREKHGDINYTSDEGDPLYKGAYFGTTARPRELVFVKTNRNLISPISLYWHTIIGLVLVTNKQMRNWSEYKKLRKVAFGKLYWSLRMKLRGLVLGLLRGGSTS